MTYSDLFRKQLTFRESKMLDVRRQPPVTKNALLIFPMPDKDPRENQYMLHLIQLDGRIGISVALVTTKDVDPGSLSELLAQGKLPPTHIKKSPPVRLLAALDILKTAGHLLSYKPL